MATTPSLSGFPEFLPKEQILLDEYKKFLVNRFEQYGFCPIETPAVERLETLTAKGGDHEIYALSRLADPNAMRDLGLRFDLTVPLARYVAQHQGDLVFPYRRYHIAPVWRGERPQKGRYRQFYQCDIDVIGRGTLSPLYDGEVVAIMGEILTTLWGPEITVHINHRKILEAWLNSVNSTDHPAAMRIIDKRGKVPLETLESELQAMGVKSGAFLALCETLEADPSLEARLALCRTLGADESMEELMRTLDVMNHMGFPMTTVCLDPLLARGLAYYTGTVYEITLNDAPHLGTVCAGGRYENLAENFSAQVFPGVGISLGLSRLFTALVERASEVSLGDILVTVQNPQGLPLYLQIASLLRAEGWRVETFLEEKPLKNQLSYANQKGFSWTVIANEDELNQGQVQLRHLPTGNQNQLSIQSLPSYLQIFQKGK